MNVFRSKPKPSTWIFLKCTVGLLVAIAWSVGGVPQVSLADQPMNTLEIQNDSGQFALVKVVGPTKAVVKLPLDHKRTTLLSPGEYYILVRFGFAPKEYVYTKGDPFTVTQQEKQFSYTTITLHRIVMGMKNPHQVSSEEFENFKLHGE